MVQDKLRLIMTHVRVEVEGRTDEVVRILRHLGGKARDATGGGVVGAIDTPVSSGEDPPPATGSGGVS